MLDAIEKTSLLTNNLIDLIVIQMEATLAQGKKNIKWYNKEINEVLFSQPYSRARVIADILKIKSRTTLTKYMDELVNTGILSRKKDGTEIYYLNDDLIRILERQ
jgi:Fic family protein